MKNSRNLLDKISERLSRGLAQNTSRRGLVGLLGAGIVGMSSIPLLPVARAANANQPKVGFY